MLTHSVGLKTSFQDSYFPFGLQFHAQHIFQTSTYLSNLLQFTQQQKSLKYQSSGLQMDGTLKILRLPSLQFSTAYMYSGYAKNSHQFTGSLNILQKSYQFNHKDYQHFLISVEGLDKTMPVSLFQQNFYANHFIYNNKFQLTGDKHIEGRFIFIIKQTLRENEVSESFPLLELAVGPTQYYLLILFPLRNLPLKVTNR